MTSAQKMTMADYDRHVNKIFDDGRPSHDPMVKVFREEQRARTNRRAAFLAEQDAKYEAWRQANGVKDKVIRHDDGTITRIVGGGSGHCGGGGTPYNHVLSSAPLPLALLRGAPTVRTATNERVAALAKKRSERRNEQRKELRKKGLLSAAIEQRRRWGVTEG